MPESLQLCVVNHVTFLVGFHKDDQLLSQARLKGFEYNQTPVNSTTTPIG
jgi:hypothetical protein